MAETNNRSARLVEYPGKVRRKRRADANRDLPDPPHAGLVSEEVYQGLAGFRNAMRRFLAFSEVAISAEGITSQQYQALLVIRTQPDHRIIIKDLAKFMLLQANGAVQLVDRLASAKLVERSESPVDRRSVVVSITKEGERLLEQLAADHLQEILKHEPLLADSLKRLRNLGRVS